MASGPFMTLLCPRDTLPLERRPLPRGSAEWSCGRHAYPEIDGIPVLLETRDARVALDAARTGDAETALATLLAPDRWGRSETLARLADRVVGSERWSGAQRRRRVAAFRRRHGTAPPPTYREALERLLLGRPSPQVESFHYFLHRPSDPTYLVAEAVTTAVPAGGDVLDVCCGSGHLTRLLTAGGDRPVTGLDESFALVYLAKRYLAPAARFVCGRADRPLPFPARRFRAVVCSDALHDTHEPAVLAREILRVLRGDGTAFVIHLHNPSFDHAYRGRNPMSPAGYASIFEGGDPRLLDEGPILEHWLASREVDLAASRPPSELEGARTVALLAGDRTPDRLHRGTDPTASRLALNPMYVPLEDSGGRRLERRWPSETYRREYPDAERYLPKSVPLDSETFEGLRNGRLSPRIADWVRRRVLLDLPADYGIASPWDPP